jgi:hypothetical protein
MTRPPSGDGEAAARLLDEAQQLLRLNWAQLLAYYAGALPFAVFFLFYWTEMARGAEAWRRLAAWSLVLALLFAWHCLCQSLSFSGLRRELGGLEPGRWTRAGLWRALSRQTLLQASSLVVLPLSALLMLPLGWALAFYQNACVLEDGSPGLRLSCALAWKRACERPGQNHRMLGLLATFAPFALAGLAGLLAALPYLLKAFSGLESEFTRSRWAFMNSTFLMAVLALGWLLLDPLCKAAYALRCHEAEARESGSGLRQALKEFRDAA